MTAHKTVALDARASFADLQRVVHEIYSIPNGRWFDLADMATNVSRFTMRALKAVRRDDPAKVERNMAIAISWFTSSTNRLHLDVMRAVWKRFPYACATCRRCPCQCTRGSPDPKPAPTISIRPSSIADVQDMFAAIYSPQFRSLEHAAIHLAEEVGELQESIMMYRSRHRPTDFKQISIEAADYMSCALGLYSSLQLAHPNRKSCAQALAQLFQQDCHKCGQVPCDCPFDVVMNYNLGDKW